jgi:hypothetical protein
MDMVLDREGGSDERIIRAIESGKQGQLAPKTA